MNSHLTSSLAIVNFLDQNYFYQSVATKFFMMLGWYQSHTLAEKDPPEDQTNIASQSITYII